MSRGGYSRKSRSHRHDRPSTAVAEGTATTIATTSTTTICLRQHVAESLRQILPHLDHAVVRGVDEVGREAGDVGQDLGAFDEAHVGVGALGYGVAELLAVLLGSALCAAREELLAQVTCMRIEGDGRDRAVGVRAGYGV